MNNFLQYLIDAARKTFGMKPRALYSGFLENDANTRNMNRLSIGSTDAGFDDMLTRHKALGFNQVLLLLANERDGGPVPTTFYQDWYGEVSRERVRMMRVRILKAKAAGMDVELWCMTDDSPTLHKGSDAQIIRHYQLCVELFGDITDRWCVGLELDEYWSRRWPLVVQCTKILQATGKPVAVHLTTYRNIELAKATGATVFNAQFGWLSNTSEMRSAMQWINARRGNLKIVASEFNRDSTTPLATALATEAMACGAIGTQTGRPK